MCLSYQGAHNTVNRICEDHDVEVQMWADNLLPVIDEPSSLVSNIVLLKHAVCAYMLNVLATSKHH